MAVKSNKLGPGRLTFGAVGSSSEWGTSISNARVVPEAGDGEVITVLSGDEIVDAEDETWKLEGTVYQAYDAESLLVWANTNTGTEQEFVFVPDDSNVLKVTGRALVRSLAIGGDVKARNTSDFSFKAVDVVIDVAGSGG